MVASAKFSRRYCCSSHQFHAGFWNLLLVYSSHILIDPKTELAKLIVYYIISTICGWDVLSFACPYNLDFCESNVLVIDIQSSAHLVQLIRFQLSSAGYLLLLLFLAKLDVPFEPGQVMQPITTRFTRSCFLTSWPCGLSLLKGACC